MRISVPVLLLSVSLSALAEENLPEDSSRSARLFLVSSSSTTSTISTTTYCYVSNAAKACKRKKRALSYADTIQPLEHREEISSTSVVGR